VRLYSKEGLIKNIHEIFKLGWHRSVKDTIDFRNDGAVGNTLEALLGIEENNLPIPNAQEWELKGQRSHTSSLVTLKHIEPSPVALRIVPKMLLPYYGWRHKQAGTKYPDTERSFRSTTSATNYTNRGFRLIADRQQKKLRFIFDPSKAKTDDKNIASWVESVKEIIGLGPLNPEPFWGLEDLKYTIGSKIRNCFYVVADSKVEAKREFFLYRELHVLAGFSFEKFIDCIEHGAILVDFDARTGHNHGTKFRIRQGHWTDLYSSIQRII